MAQYFIVSARQTWITYAFCLFSPCTGKQLRSESWKALEDLKKEGKVRSIGVSNYGIHHLKEVFEVGTIKPAVNQIEVTNLSCCYAKLKDKTS